MKIVNYININKGDSTVPLLIALIETDSIVGKIILLSAMIYIVLKK